jgi:hypothetical protein
VTNVLADGELQPGEAKFVVAEILKRWAPDIAAGRTIAALGEGSKEAKVVGAVHELISQGGYSMNSLPEAVLSIRRLIK